MTPKVTIALLSRANVEEQGWDWIGTSRIVKNDPTPCSTPDIACDIYSFNALILDVQKGQSFAFPYSKTFSSSQSRPM